MSCFIVAEAGINHNGDVRQALELIDAARQSGADAVKFQTFKAELLQLEIVRGLELSEDNFRELSDYAKGKIMFFSTPFDNRSVDLLDELGVPMFKVSSGKACDLPLLRHIASKGKPVILSTGMCTFNDIDRALGILDNVTLLYCVSNYPTEYQDVNLKAMLALRMFSVPVGFSDHTIGTFVPSLAVALGAEVIEKHITLDKSVNGPDHKVSLEPPEFREMVENIRNVEKILGHASKEGSRARRGRYMSIEETEAELKRVNFEEEV